MKDFQGYVIQGRFVAFGSKEEIKRLAIEDFKRYISILKIQNELKQEVTGEQR